MPDQVVPITQLDQTGVILDNPPVSLPPNAFTNARNVRFKDGAVRKMEGEVDIFPRLTSTPFTGGNLNFFDLIFNGRKLYGEVQYIAWWPSPNQTSRDSGYYIMVVEDVGDPDNIVHDILAIAPDANLTDPTAVIGSERNRFRRIGTGYSRQGKWQHTLFNGGFTFIINNGVDRPQYVTDPEGNTDITNLSLADLPGWDSYEVNELLLRDTFVDTSSRVFDTGQTREAGVTQYIVTRTRAGVDTVLLEGSASTAYTVTQQNNLDVITFGDDAVQIDDQIQVNFQSINPVTVRAGIVRSFGDFLVAGNLVERDSVTAGNPIIRRLTGVVRSSDVAQPGAIPANWNPFAAGVSTADEFVIADTGTVQDMVPLQGSMYLYTNSSISVMRLTGNPQVPLAVQPVTDQYGTLTTDAVLEYDGKHFVIGSDDIYLFGGHPGSIQSISDTKIRRAFFNRVNPINDNLRNLFTLRYAARDEIWICFPTNDSIRGECDEAYIWNYRNGTWTIRTLNSVIRGDIGPVPGGGIPSAIISIDGESGTDDVIQVGSREVQTLQVLDTATVGHAANARPAIFNFQTLDAAPAPSNAPRPALDLDAPELVEVTIGDDFYSGPNPALQEYNILNIPDFTFGPFASGGARFQIEYTSPTANTGNDNTMITVHANEIDFPLEGNPTRTITGIEFAARLATHLRTLPEFQDWTITDALGGNEINLRSTLAGMRELRGLSITTFTSTVEEITDVGPFDFGQSAMRTFTDSFGDELFTVTRLGDTAPYTFNVVTSRDTGFTDSDSITQLAFITDGNTFAAPDPFNSGSGGFTFQSTSGEFGLRAIPPANFVNLVEETDRIPDNGLISDTTTEDGVTIERRSVEGGYTRESRNAANPLNDVNEGTSVQVVDVTTPATTTTGPADPSDTGGAEMRVVPGNSGSISVGADSGIFIYPVTASSSRASGQAAAAIPGGRFPATNGANSWGSQISNAFIIGTLGSSVGTSITNPGYRTIAENGGNNTYTATLNGTTHTIRCCDTRTATRVTWNTNVTNTGGFTRFVNMNVGGIAPASVGLSFQAGRTDPTVSDPSFATQFGRASGTTIRLFYPGYTTTVPVPAIPRRRFDVTNSNPFDIAFTRQGTSVGTIAAGASATFTGPDNNADESWSWVNQPVSLSGTAISGSGTQDLRGSNGARTTSGSGITVVSQNTATPQTTTTGQARDQAVLLPANNGGSISNPLTATYNPTREFQSVNWTGDNRAEFLSAYRLSNGSRVTGGGSFGRFNNPPPGWDNGFESGSFPVTPLFSATNITNPVALGTVTTTVQRGVINTNSQGSSCDNPIPATATGQYGSNGIRQAGSATNRGPAIGIDARRGRAGFNWNVPSTGRSNECGGNLRGGVSFSGDFRVYADQDDPAVGVRIVLFGPMVTSTVTVPRASSETFTVTNNNPFPVTFSGGGQNVSIAADSTQTITVSGSEGNSWSISTPTTTNFQYVLTNNNERPLVSGTLIHDSDTIDLAGLEPGGSRSTGFSTVNTATATFVRQVEQSGAMTVTTPVDLMLVRSGIGSTPTALEDLESVRYRFRTNFTDSTPDVDVIYQTPENRNPTATDNLNNEGAIEGYVRALLSDEDFNRYFIVHTTAVITEGSASSVLDNEVDANQFRIEARAAPGNTYTLNGQTLTMPPHDALDFMTEVNMQNGGNADVTTMSIQRGVNTDNDPITISVRQGTQVPQTDGTFMDVTLNTHDITLNGSFSDDTAGGTAITEVVRDHLRLDTSFTMTWMNTDTANSPMLTFTSVNDGPHFITVDQVSPAASGLLPTHLPFTETQLGTVAPATPVYPTIRLDPPIGTALLPEMIELSPLPSMTSTDRLNNIDITNIIRARFDVDGWDVISDTDPNIGDAPGATQIRIVRADEGEVVSGNDQTMGWRVGDINYGNTGLTLPGLEDPANDGAIVGRLNTTDFVRADSQGIVSDTNPLITATGMGDNLDFRGSTTERSQRTHIMVQISTPDVTSMDPVFGPDGNLLRDDDGNVQLAEGNTQYIPIIIGGTGDYNAVDQTGSQPATRRSAEEIVTTIQSRINTTNRRVQVTRNGPTELSIIPSQFSELANFVVDIFINDTTDNVDRWNAIVNANRDTQNELFAVGINTDNNMGIQSTVPANVDSTTDQQFNPGNRVPNFATRNVVTDGLVTNTSQINEVFDPLRPWPTSQVNLNREYPIFVTAVLDPTTGDLTQHIRGADLGFLYLNDFYESFVERIELAMTPEFDTEQLQSLALWGDGGSQVSFGEDLNQATLNVNMYGSDAPGSTLGEFNTGNSRMITNDYVVGQDYKIDMRVHGRFLNLRITDNVDEVVNDGENDITVPANFEIDTNLGVPRGISWSISGMQADIFKGGRR